MKIPFKDPPSVARLRELFTYHEEEHVIGGHGCVGGFKWNFRLDVSNSWNSRYAGKFVGTWAKDNRVYAMVDRSQFQLSVLVWAYYNRELPRPLLLDHINRNSLDNRISNLRLASVNSNNANRSPTGNTTSKYRGVYLSSRGKWVAQIKVNREVIYLGSFLTEEEAARVRDEASIKYFGEFAYLNFLDEVADATSL